MTHRTICASPRNGNIYSLAMSVTWFECCKENNICLQTAECSGATVIQTRLRLLLAVENRDAKLYRYSLYRDGICSSVEGYIALIGGAGHCGVMGFARKKGIVIAPREGAGA